MLVGLAAAAALVPVAAAPNAGAAGVLPDGTNVRTLSPVRGNYINNTLMGVECKAPKICTPIAYPSFVTASGVARLDAVLKGGVPPGTVIYAYSNGAQVATHWMTEHARDPGVPSADSVTFVLMGNSLRAHGGVDAELGISKPSQYQVIDIAREYDPVADYPDDHFNFLAVANALAGSQSLHDYRPVDINDPNNIVWTEGNITYVLVPTENLPLLDGLRRIGLTKLADKMNAELKPKIDAAYDRSYIPASALTPSSAAALDLAPAAPAPAATVSKAVAPQAISAKTTDVAMSAAPKATSKTRAATTTSRANGTDTGNPAKALTRALTKTLTSVTSSLRPTASTKTTGGTPSAPSAAHETGSSDKGQSSSSGSAGSE